MQDYYTLTVESSMHPSIWLDPCWRRRISRPHDRSPVNGGQRCCHGGKTWIAIQGSPQSLARAPRNLARQRVSWRIWHPTPGYAKTFKPNQGKYETPRNLSVRGCRALTLRPSTSRAALLVLEDGEGAAGELSHAALGVLLLLCCLGLDVRIRHTLQASSGMLRERVDTSSRQHGDGVLNS